MDMEDLPTYEAAMAERNTRPPTPPVPSEVSSTPPVLIEESLTSLILSEVSSTPPAPSEASSTPVLSEESSTLPILSEESSTPPALSEISSTASELSEELSTSIDSSEVPSNPPGLSEAPSTPSEFSEATATLPVTAKTLLNPPITSKASLNPPIISKVPSSPSTFSEEFSATPVLSDIPSAPSAYSPPYIPQTMQPNFGILIDETVRRVCSEYAERNFKNGSSIIEQMTFSNKRSFYSLHYKLETFLEWRESEIKYGKCNGKAIDGPNNGPEPNLRSVFVVCRQKFQNGETRVAIPHSEHLRTCRQCDDRGKEDCPTCRGAGWNHCSSCGGGGYLKDRSSCITCNKSGRLICDPCYSSGRINCTVCDGYKKVKSYKELKVTWKNHVDEYDVNPTDLPTDLLKSSTGSEIFSEESPRIQPLTLFPEAAINIASLKLVLKHQKDCNNNVILLQKHTIRAIPITRLNYYFKGKTGEVYVYGNENSVYFENFPTPLDRNS